MQRYLNGKIKIRNTLTTKLLRKSVTSQKRSCATNNNNCENIDKTNENHIKLDDKVAIVNGGASGIGLAIAKELLRNGLQCLAIVDCDRDRGEEITDQLTAQHGDDCAVYFQADVSNSKLLDKVYRQVIQYYDVPNIVINSAGIMNDSCWEKQLNTNLAGCAVGTLLGMQYMSKSSHGRGGVIVNIASILGIIPSTGCPLHTMTQFGVCGFSKAMGAGSHFDRTEVKIMALCPGLTDTPLLSEAPKTAINENFSQEFYEEITGTQLLKPETVAKCLIGLLDEAKPGSIWVVEDGLRPYEIAYPGVHLRQMKNKKPTTGHEEASFSLK